jgi:hypothetical protein
MADRLARRLVCNAHNSRQKRAELVASVFEDQPRKDVADLGRRPFLHFVEFKLRIDEAANAAGIPKWEATTI